VRKRPLRSTLTPSRHLVATLSISATRISLGKRFDSVNPMEWKDLVDFELRNYSFRYDRTVLDEEKPYNELPLVRRLAAAALMKCRDKVKHKEVNDLSGIFL
jgi:hypothetical protein